MANYKMHDAQDNAFRAMTDAMQFGHTPIYNARGCDYEFEITQDVDRNHSEYGVVVYCFNSDGNRVWSGSTSIGQNIRIIDAVRAARNSSRL